MTLREVGFSAEPRTVAVYDLCISPALKARIPDDERAVIYDFLYRAMQHMVQKYCLEGEHDSI